MKYPKLWNGASPIGEALVRALQRTRSPFLRSETADGITAGKMSRLSEVKQGDECVFRMENGFLAPGGYTTNQESIALNEPGASAFSAATLSSYSALSVLFPTKFSLTEKLRIAPSSFDGALGGFSTAIPDTTPVQYDFSKQGTLAAKNFCALFSPPQKYTGLMQRFVSALYGRSLSALERIGFGPTMDGLGIAVFRNDPAIDQGVQLYSAPNIATGIFKSSTGRYWLIFVSNAWCNYVELTPTKCGKKLRKYRDRKLNAGKLSAEQAPLLESYIFCELQPEGWRDGAVSWRSAGTFTTAGTSWVYGWKFNATGSEAALVTHEATGTGPGSRFVSRRYRAVFVESVVDGVASLSVSVTLHETSAPWASTRLRLWTPTLLGMTAEYLGVSGVDTDASSIPLMCAYTEDDDLHVLRWSKEPGLAANQTTVTKTVSGSGPAGFPSAWMDVPYGVGPTGYGVFTERVDERLIGDGATHALGGVSGVDVLRNEERLHAIAYTPGSRVFFREVATADGNADQWSSWFGFNPSRASIPYPSGDRWRVFNELPIANSQERWSTMSRTSAPQFVLAIPRDNASSWYEAKYVSEYVGTRLGGGFYVGRTCLGNTIFYHEEKTVGTTHFSVAGPNVPTGTLPEFDSSDPPNTTVSVSVDLVVNGARLSCPATQYSELFDTGSSNTGFVLFARKSLHGEVSFVSFENTNERFGGWPDSTTMSIGWQ